MIFQQAMFEYQRVLCGSMGQIWIVAKQFGLCSLAEAKVLAAGGHRLPRTRQGVSNHKGSCAPHDLCGVSLWLVVLGVVALGA